ncbi:hypothetical protein LTR60_003338 [Cryomyces antarcticus]|nr:hypothetical protein LTR60_003338 [Cryomyces antarcticus]
MSKTEQDHGWTAVPLSHSKLLASRPEKKESQPMNVADIPLPDSPLVKAVMAYAKGNLRAETFHHSMRVFYYGTYTAYTVPCVCQAITTQHFPTWTYSPETYLLTCLLHDIGTSAANLRATYQSFEFYGAQLALALLSSHKSPQAQSEAVAEAIIRHQDLGETGNITTVGALIQLATVFDNMGMNGELVHMGTVENVVEAWPRKGWSGCFGKTIREEIGLKPWCHTTIIEGFAEGVEGNKLMEPYE